MNKKGQAALEYLMTYGWALIVIAIVVGVLVFIVASPAGGVTCNSSNPTKILFKSSNYVAGAAVSDSLSVVQLQNATGGDIDLDTACTATGNWTVDTEVDGTTRGDDIDCDTFGTTLGTVNAGAILSINPNITAAEAIGDAINNSVTLLYDDQFGYPQTVTITCQGTI